MPDPVRKIDEAGRVINRGLNAPGQAARDANSRVRNLKAAPRRNMQQIRSRAKAVQQAPGRRMKQMRNNAMAPIRGVRGQMNHLGGAAGGLGGKVGLNGQQYKRRADRMSNTDFSVSAMLYPLAWILTPIAGFVADWDTAFIRYHLAHARILGFLSFLLVPAIIVTLFIDPVLSIAPIVLLMLFWMYTWFLGFRAYGGNIVLLPFISGWLIRRGRVDFDTIEARLTGAPADPVRVHYNPHQGRGF
jgi:uncharacterized membrane protein